MKTNKYAMVIHNVDTDKTSKLFLFKLKKGQKAKEGDIAICETMHGTNYGRITEIFQAPENLEDAIISKYNAYAPLKEIVFVIPANYYSLITRKSKILLEHIYCNAIEIVDRVDSLGLFGKCDKGNLSMPF